MKKGVKRKKTSKKVVRHKVSKRPNLSKKTKKHNYVKTLAIVLVAAFVLLLVAGFVGRLTGYGFFDWLTGKEDKSFLENFWDQFKQGEKIDEGITKILFGFLIGVIIFGIAKKIPGVKDVHISVQIIFSVVIAYLGVAYITPSELTLMLTSYSALGFTIGIIIPFLVLLYLTYDIGTEVAKDVKGTISQKIMTYILWSIYGLYLLYKLSQIYILKIGENDVPSLASALILILFIATFVIILMLGKIFKRLGETVTKEQLARYRLMNQKQVGKLKADVTALEEAATAPS